MFPSFLRYIWRHDRQSSNSLRHLCNMSRTWADDEKIASDWLFFFPWNAKKKSTHRWTKFLDFKCDSSRITEHDRSSVSACRWSWSSHRCQWQDYATNYETSDHQREQIYELRSWRLFGEKHMCQQNRTRYWSRSYTQFQCDVLDARSNEKVSRRSERSESETRR